MSRVIERIRHFATAVVEVCNFAPPSAEEFDMRRLEQPLVLVNPNALTHEEAEALRRDGFRVPKAQPAPSIWR